MIIYASYAVRDRRRWARQLLLANVRYAFGVQQIAVALLGHKSNWSYGGTRATRSVASWGRIICMCPPRIKLLLIP